MAELMSCCEVGNAASRLRRGIITASAVHCRGNNIHNSIKHGRTHAVSCSALPRLRQHQPCLQHRLHRRRTHSSQQTVLLVRTLLVDSANTRTKH